MAASLGSVAASRGPLIGDSGHAPQKPQNPQKRVRRGFCGFCGFCGRMAGVDEEPRGGGSTTAVRVPGGFRIDAAQIPVLLEQAEGRL